MGVSLLKQQLFGTTHFVCGGHGARRPSHGMFAVPQGITIHFYIPDTDGLPNNIGQQVDRVLTGQPGPPPVETFNSGNMCHNYHLYSSKGGGYLNLGMSSTGNDRYITTDDKDNGSSLESICSNVLRKVPKAVIHWSACRAIEPDGFMVGWSKPKYYGNVNILSKKH